MALSRSRIQENLEDVQKRMEAAAARVGRPAESVRLIAVTKAVGVEEARIIHELGVKHLGENRIHIAKEKIEAMGDTVCWHMIGSLQRRKARDVAALFQYFDAVDRIEIAEALQRRCEEVDKVLQVLIEVNVSGELAKHGFEPDALHGAIKTIKIFERLEVKGLMTMAPFVDDPEEVRPVFARLRELAQGEGLEELSMGMTNDYEVAIEEGATQVRIGTALFV